MMRISRDETMIAKEDYTNVIQRERYSEVHRVAGNAQQRKQSDDLSRREGSNCYV
ncbi:hypothetical protein [Desmospora activa]|nr:hypothetical protein [Desmospora activa]